MSQEIEIGLGKKARLGYALDDVAIVPSRRTRDISDVDLSWQVDAYQFDVPVLSAPMDSVTSPATAIALGKMGGLGVLDLEGLWTRYEDPTPYLEEISQLPADIATKRIQEIYSAPIRPELITQRLHEIRDAGVTVVGAAGEATKTIYDFDQTGAFAWVMGAEGPGLRQLTRKRCDDLAKIPLTGSVESLNVSVATGICLFESVRQRFKAAAK